VVSGVPSSPRRVGFVGAGSLGLPMAAVTAAAGFDVAVRDTDPARLDAAAARGLPASASLAELSHWADCVVTVLPSASDLPAVVGRPGDPGDSLTARRRPGLLIIDVGSGAPIATRELATGLADAGHLLVDAPVSGSPQRAEEATLVALVGGTDEAVEAASVVVAASCATQLRIGGPGAGHAAKVVNNLLAAAHLAATVEALILARAAGFDPAAVRLTEDAPGGADTAATSRVGAR
jgi:3-hydroxyisobutyrate dehydrogenase